jgi:sugar lactone lactonase YvrE
VVFVSKWGTSGGGDGQFNTPDGISVASDGSIYVSDTINNRIQKFTSAGVYISKWGTNGDSLDGYALNHPAGVAVAPDGSVYVADTHHRDYGRILKFTSEGVLVTKWGTNGWGDGGFRLPHGVAVASDGSVYVSEWNQRFQKFTSAGVYISKSGGSGQGNGKFQEPYGIAVASDGSVYVADRDSNRIQKFTYDTSQPWSAGVFLTKWGTYGASDGQFSQPYGIAVASDGSVYVADTGNHRIQKFTSEGVFVSKWGTEGTGDGQFSYPRGVAVASDGSVYVADTGNHRIQKFTVGQ